MIEYKPWSTELALDMAQKASEGEFACLEIEISGQCTYNCVYCESPHREWMSTLDIEKACELLASKQFSWLYICGIGEPTYASNEEQLLEVLEACCLHNVKCSIFTNLSNLSPRLIEYVRCGVLFLVFKFDSQDTDVLNALYNPVDLETHLSNIALMEELVQCDGKHTNIAASIVPTTKNVEEIPRLVQWCLDRDIYPLVAQLEYAGAAIGVFDNLMLDDDALLRLKQTLNDVYGEEYRVPFCPAVFAGVSLTYDNKIVIDRRTGLSCHSFWLDDPDLEVVCDDVSSIELHDINPRVSLRHIMHTIIDKRIERYDAFVRNVKEYKRDIFGGCGGNKEDIFGLYIKHMDESLKDHPANNNLVINRFVYLDNNATTQVSPAVREKMNPYWNLSYANPNSSSTLGRNARKTIDEARVKVARSLHADASQIYFTSSGSEGNNWAIHCCCTVVGKRTGKDIILTTETEHASVHEKMMALREDGYSIQYIDLTPQGDIDVNKLESFAEWNRVAFASVVLANNETGIINDIPNLSLLLRRHGILFHCDAVQALGKMELDVTRLGVDYLTVSGHKIYAPKGIGAMYVRETAPLTPMIYGHQEIGRRGGKDIGFRGGTENVAFIAALGQAVEDVYATRDGETFKERMKRISDMRDEIEQTIMKCEWNPYIHGCSANRVGNTSNFGFSGIEAIKLLVLLESRGIYVSLGAACESGEVKPSRVLVAMGSPIQKYGSIRVSLSENTRKRDIEYFNDNLLECLRKMKKGV